MNTKIKSTAAVRHPIVAAIYDRFTDRYERRILGAEREKIVGKACGEVLEIAAGTGRNLSYYTRQVSHLTAVEPDPFMRRRAEARGASLPFPIRWSPAVAEELPFEREKFDSVVVTLAFCTFNQPVVAAREIRRVLKPSGRFYFIEHVRSGRPGRGRLQDLIVPFWKLIAAGCRPNRNTCPLLERGGFTLHRLETFDDGMLWVGPFVSGEAVPGFP